MKKILWYILFTVLSSHLLIAQTEPNNNFDNLENKDGKNQKAGACHWSLINKADIMYNDGKVGIGTRSPLSTLHVEGTIRATRFIMPGGNSGDVLTYSPFGTAYWAAPPSGNGQSIWNSVSQGIIYNPSGSNTNVGIGVDTPSEKLHVDGKILTEGGLKMQGSTNSIVFGGSASSTFNIVRETSSKGISPPPPGAQSNILTVNANNFVGIGKTNPSVKLDVNGSIRTNDELTFDPEGEGIISFGSAVKGQSLKILSNYKEGLKSNINGLSITSNGNVGIGLANPTAKLEVDGKTKTKTLQVSGGACQSDYVLTATDTVGNATWKNLNDINIETAWTEDVNGNIFRQNGNVGIGTNNPNAPLHIDYGSQTIGLKFTGIDYGSSANHPDFNIETDFTSFPELKFKNAAQHSQYIWSCGGVDKMTLKLSYSADPFSTFLNIDGKIITQKFKLSSNKDVDGYVLQSDAEGNARWVKQWLHTSSTIYTMKHVGIGVVNTGTHQLVVNGSINAKEILVTETVPSSDYVFEEDYVLMPLSELEKFVNEQKHLPEVMSAKEFAENGYNLGEMDDVLLRKVEELTLYIIQQQKEIDGLKNKLSILEQ